jgi:hypothetical protein
MPCWMVATESAAEKPAVIGLVGREATAEAAGEAWPLTGEVMVDIGWSFR